jgi:polysaccharide export outer membrane protein
MISRHVQTPTIFALGPPQLLIPADHSTRADTGRNIDWTAAFTHELAHVTRGDGWTRLWVEFVLIALPLQPLVWLARRAFHVACEEACDDWAVATGTNPVDLADTLTAWITGSQPTAGLVTIGMSSTKSRTLRLLALRSKPIARLNRAWRWIGLPAGLLLITGLAIAQSPTGKRNEPAHPATPVAVSNAEDDAAKEETGSSSQMPGGKGRRASLPPYVIEPPDVLTITPVQLVPKGTMRVGPLDNVQIEVDSAPNAISGKFQVDSSGDVVLGALYGAVKISGLTRLEAQEAVKKKLAEILTNPRVALTIDETRRETGISGKHLVAPDGTINLGIYGSVDVDGKTIAEARAAVEKKLSDLFVDPKVAVDVSEYKSKFFYMIIGEQVDRRQLDVNETVLDAILGPISGNWDSNKEVFVSRRSSSGKVQRLEVNWKEVIQGDDTTNYKILPGDRVFVQPKDK